MTHTILRIPAAKSQSGYSRSTINLRIAQGLWTKPVIKAQDGPPPDAQNLATPDNSRNCAEPPKLPLAFTVMTSIKPTRLGAPPLPRTPQFAPGRAAGDG